MNDFKCILKSAARFRSLFLVALVTLFAVTAHAQGITVKGTVVDPQGEPLIGASVLVKGTSNGTATDIDGNFTLNNVASNARLEFRYVGYKPLTVDLKGQTSVNVTLEEDNANLEELVVVGYGVQRKADVTGATANVSGKDLTSMPVKNAVEGMQGKAAGVDISSSQRPGEIGDINIRGVRSIGASNSPLYVVDGMVLQNGGIENINPQDIEKIDILKDASATAIYGSRGANGVVLVTTKKGHTGKVSVSYSGSVSIDTQYNVMKQMTAAQWLQYSRYAAYRGGQYPTNPYSEGPSYAGDQNRFGLVEASWANVDKAWVNGVYDESLVGSFDWESYGKRTGVSTEHTVGLSGGTENFQGYGSFGYLHQKGVTPGQDYTRYTMKASFDLTPKNWILKAGVSINGSYSDQEYGYSFRKSVTGAGDYFSALQGMLPWTVPFDANGEYIKHPNGDTNIINPINELNYTTNNRKTFRANGLVYGQLDFEKIWSGLQGLSYRIQFGPEFTYYTYGTADAADGVNGDGNNKASTGTQQRRSWTLDNLIYYNRDFAEKHRLNVTLLQSASSYHYENRDMSAFVSTAKELWWNLSSNNAIQSYGTGLSENSMTSYMARAYYSFDDRYMITASIRWDGASVLADGHKWATFPSVALAWRINQEKFLRDVEWIDQLKLRLGYGVTGNAAIAPYSTKGGIQTINYPFGNDNYVAYVPSDVTARYPNALANQDLTWEKTTQYNVGVDFSFLNGRLSGSIDWYRTKTKDLLLPMTIPSLNGYTTTNANVGRTAGHGWDIQLNSINIQHPNFTWNTSLTFSLDRCQIEELNNGILENITNNWFVGEQLGVYYDYVYDGIWKTSEAAEAEKAGRKPGEIRVKDLNGDGKIDANNDRQIVGHVRPDWTAGLTNTFKLYDFDFSLFIFSRWGFTVPGGAARLDGRYMTRDLDYWIEGINEDARYPAPLLNTSGDAYWTSLDYVKGSFIKVRNISVGYTLPDKWLKSLGVGLSNVRIYAQVNNPFFIYKSCKFLDTDLMNYNDNKRNFGSGTSIRSYTFGLNVTF